MNDLLLAQAQPPGRPIPAPPAQGGGTAPMAPSNSVPGATVPAVPPPQDRVGTRDIFRPPATVSNTDMLVAGGIVLALAMVFYVAKRGLAKHLIERKASPSHADRTGWMLWIMLMSLTLSAGAMYIGRKALFGSRFALNALIDGPAALAMSGFGIVFLVSGLLFILYYRSARHG